MIIINSPKFIKNEQGQSYLVSRSIDWGVFCDYSATESMVEIEDTECERHWLPVSGLFYNCDIREGIHIGLLTGNTVRTYKVTAIEGRQRRNRNYLYAQLEDNGGERPLTQEDYPLDLYHHDLVILEKEAVKSVEDIF